MLSRHFARQGSISTAARPARFALHFLQQYFPAPGSDFRATSFNYSLPHRYYLAVRFHRSARSFSAPHRSTLILHRLRHRSIFSPSPALVALLHRLHCATCRRSLISSFAPSASPRSSLAAIRSYTPPFIAIALLASHSVEMALMLWMVRRQVKVWRCGGDGG